jgi:23S rRNA (adenine-N6)-dimethyltransferase
VEDAAISPGDLVLDVGAGSGALAAQLVAAGARVIAVELHDGRAQQLRERFWGEPVVVVVADASDLRLPRQPFRVVANPPFAVTTALIRRLLSPGSRLVRADLVVPWHVGVRWTRADAPAAQRWCQVFRTSLVRPLPRRAFRPSATMDTVVLRIESRMPGRQQVPTARRGRRRPGGRPRPRAPSPAGTGRVRSPRG